MANWSGITATLAALARPRTLQPALVVPSIAHLDWHRLRHNAGVHAVVVDKDNCIAKPNEDDLANSDELRRAWADLLDTFGAENVLVVSNSAGDLRKDPLLIQAETVSRNLRVPVLVHRSPKPGRPCVRQIAAHFLLPRSSTTDLSSLVPSSASAAARPHSPSLAGQTIFSPLARSLLPPSRSASLTFARTTSNPSAPLKILRVVVRVMGVRKATHVPRLLARLHEPMARVVRIYTDPASLAPSPSSSSPSAAPKSVLDRAERHLESWLDSAESKWDEAGRRFDAVDVERLSQKLEEVRGAVRGRVERARERVGASGLGPKKEERVGKVER
uniref:Mitochondrial PGP phosphatase-domain containing protein n=1 Tax=Rhodotorula toruloides TaxID=5286 RepID=A0A0K3CM38_RHOTO